MANIFVTVRNSAGLSTTVSHPLVVTVPTGAPLQLELNMGGGDVITFNQASATDQGDYVGSFVHQKCLRQVIGDFMVDFRPDASGARDEVVVELGTLHQFATGVAPKTNTGNLPKNIGMPPAPVVTVTADTPATQAGPVVVLTTYVNATGESAAAEYYYVALTSGRRISVASPPPGYNATGWNVYTWASAYAGGSYARQNSTPIPIGTGWRCPDSGLIISGGVNLATPPRPNFTAYTATISGGTLTTPVTINVPIHYWRTRWRWQSAPRPIVRNHADLVAMKAITPLDAMYAYYPTGVVPAMSPRDWLGPMDIGPVATGMGGTGDRDDLGFITEWAARFLLGAGSGSESRMRSAAEATGTMRFWTRDVATGALVDTVSRPYVTYNVSANGPYLIPTQPLAIAGNTFALDQAHMPTCAYVPWLLTDDPYFLEGAQATCNYMVMEQNLTQIRATTPGITTGQARGMAWGWRDVFQLAHGTPGTMPGWILPRSYYRDKLVPAQLSWANRYLNNPARVCNGVFKLMPGTNGTQAFMQTYIGIVAGWIKWTGVFPEFDPVVNYVTHQLMVMCDPNDAYGWRRSYPSPYYMPVADARLSPNMGHAPEQGYNAVDSVNTPASFAELQDDFFKQGPTAAALHMGWYDPTTVPVDELAKPGSGYNWWLRTAYAMCALGGVTNARNVHDWMKGKLDAYTPPPQGPAKWGVPPEV